MESESLIKGNCTPYRVVKHINGSVNTPNTGKKMSSGKTATQEEIISSQALYIDNLQHQVFCLENEIACLRAQLEKVNRLQPTAFSEAEKMVQKLVESQKEIQILTVELKRKQTTVDLIRSEKDRILKKKEENEAKFYNQKTAYFEEVVELKKERDEYLEKNFELERLLQENGQQENHLQGDYDSLRVQLEELKKEVEEDKAMIESLQESKKEIQKLVFEANLRLEMKTITDNQEAINYLKGEIEELHSQLATAGSVAEHEKLLRTRLAEENKNLIKRHAEMEAELAESKAKLQEEQSFRASLEELHLKTVLEISEAKSEAEKCHSQILPLKKQLKSEKERNLALATQVADEQRFKEREEQKVSHLERQLEQKEGKIKARESENTQLLRDNAVLKDEVQHLKEQLKNRDNEVEQLKQKVQEMQVSVEEFIQSSKAATRLEGQRWKQLTQLAHGIQTLSKEAIIEKDL